MISPKEIAELIKLLGDVVKSTREIVKAVNDGKDYLRTRFPDAQGDLADLLGQMRLTIVGLAEVTKVISSFRFVYDGTNLSRDSAERELARFNEYIIAQKVDIARLHDHIGELKANCEKVRDLRDKLDTRTGTREWGSMFGLLGAKARQRSSELHGVISNFYADDQRMIDLINATLVLAERAIEDVNASLGPAGTMNPANLPLAAGLLGKYAGLFQESNARLRILAEDLEGAKRAIA